MGLEEKKLAVKRPRALRYGFRICWAAVKELKLNHYNKETLHLPDTHMSHSENNTLAPL